jgi:ABC-type sugar transport system ATPase subunit
MEVYENPATIFVAGFIGSPAMNFVMGRAETDGRIALGGAGSVRTDVRVEPGREVTVGVRPEHLSLGGDARTAISGTVEMIEQLGADTLVHVAADKAQIVARLPHGMGPEVGTAVTLAADPSRVYVFDAATGARIR